MCGLKAMCIYYLTYDDMIWVAAHVPIDHGMRVVTLMTCKKFNLKIKIFKEMKKKTVKSRRKKEEEYKLKSV